MTPFADNDAINRLIYIAGPISNGNKLGAREIFKNVQNGEDLYMKLVEMGYNPICPHFSYYPWLRHERDIHWKTWLAMDENYVRACPLLFYMEPKKYGESKGAKHEYNLANKLDKTIYTKIDDMKILSNKEEVPA